MNPKYLFCDEPNSGLDPKTAIRIDFDKRITYEYKMTTIVITHDMNSVMEMETTFFLLIKEKMVGRTKSIINTDNKEISDFVYASGFMKGIRSVFRKA